ncbi:MAG: hypothetical protein J6P97_03500 [Bacteroidales bacterium]|nr:hypothetical protein [Bacteroidales bacterium]
MKRIMYALACLVMPFMFFSCEELEGLVGEMDLTINDETIHIPDAVFTELEGFTTIAGSNLKENVAIVFKGDSKGSYTLGLGKDLLSAAANVSNITNMENTLVYVPSSGIEEDGLTLVCGTLEITSYTKNKVKGTFSGYGLKTSILSEGELNFSSLQNNFEKVSGSFEAVGKKM